MNNIVNKIIAATILAAPFSSYAVELSIDDMYRYEDGGAYEFKFTNTPSRNVNVNLDDMYRNEGGGAYEFKFTNTPSRNVNVNLDDMYSNENSDIYNPGTTAKDATGNTGLAVASAQ